MAETINKFGRSGKMEDLPGQHFGRWTVLDATVRAPSGEIKWLCRCDCGTERYVLARSLRNNASQSCGCLSKENAQKTNSYDLLDKCFGDLTVIGRSKKRTARGGCYWTCLCSCGYTCDASSSDLVSGRKTHCGCKTVTHYAFKDITGQHFNRLTALFRVKSKTSRSGSVVWHCRCDCGNELDVSYNDLVYSNLKSCGCQKKEHDAELKNFLIHVDGTSIDAIQAEKIPSNNTTGYRGVYMVKGKYVAKIVFQKKQYFLGAYDNIADAANARKAAEKMLFKDTVLFYQRWKNRADDDPGWAASNPIRIQPFKDPDGILRVSYSPQL